METKPTLDRGLLPPVLFGAFSLFGICLALLLLRLSPLRPVAPIQSTDTPFAFLLLGTEPGFTTLTPEPEEGATDVPTDTPAGRPTARATSTSSKTSLPTTDSNDEIITFASPTRSRTPTTPPTTALATPTTASNAPLNPGTYDDADERITYIGNWAAQTNVNGVNDRTLHVSNTLDNSIVFRFIGEQVRIFYQSGSSLGTIRISVDGLEYDLDESADVVTQSEWISPLLINGTHTVSIIHLSGGSVNLDMFIIPEILKTATPTP